MQLVCLFRQLCPVLFRQRASPFCHKSVSAVTQLVRIDLMSRPMFPLSHGILIIFLSALCIRLYGPVWLIQQLARRQVDNSFSAALGTVNLLLVRCLLADL